MTQEKGKNIFDAAIDAVSNRDEKAAIEAAKQRAQQLEQQAAQVQQKLTEAEQRISQTTQKLTEAERKAKQLEGELTTARAELTKTQTELASARGELSATKSKLTVVDAKLSSTFAELQKYLNAEQAKKVAEAAEAAAKAQILTRHTLKPDETLSHVALKYYGSAGETYWRLIYEANKDTIGANPGIVRPGTEIVIPVLPENLKK